MHCLLMTHGSRLSDNRDCMIDQTAHEAVPGGGVAPPPGWGSIPRAFFRSSSRPAARTDSCDPEPELTGCSSAWQSVCLGCTKSRVRVLPSRFSLMPRSSAEPECRATNAEVVGSNPTGAVERKTDGSVAQLVGGGGLRNHTVLVRIQPESLMVNVAQPARALGCDPRGYGFDPRRSPLKGA